MRRNFSEFCESKRKQFGAQFDSTDLATQFARYFETGERIKVAFASSKGETYLTLTGTVGVTTGWKPSFLLMRRSSDHGSPYLLGVNDRIVAVRRGRTYVDI